MKHENMSDLTLDDHKFGEFKHDLKNVEKILSFQALSTSSYQVVYTTKSGQTLQKTKCCGFNLDTDIINNSLPPDLFTSFISKALENEAASESVPQIRHFVNKTSQKTDKKMLYYQLRNTLLKRRHVCKKKYPYLTLPYGFTKKMQDDADKQ